MEVTPHIDEAVALRTDVIEHYDATLGDHVDNIFQIIARRRRIVGPIDKDVIEHGTGIGAFITRHGL